MKRIGALTTLIFTLTVFCSVFPLESANAQINRSDLPHPVVPDYAADPSVVCFGKTYYLYSTSDIGKGLQQMGPPVVWKSTDMVNWSFSGTLIHGMQWDKPYTFDDAKGNKKTGYFRYWAPGKVLKKGNTYYLYATIVKPNGAAGTYLLLGKKPEGPFHFCNGTGVYFNELDKVNEEAKPVAPDIDGDPFVNDDGKAYLFWRKRKASILSDDWKSLTGPLVTISTTRDGYSEGPFMFKRKNIYYYLYTLSGNANYFYPYMISNTSPLGPFVAPTGPDVILSSKPKTGIWGPGHGNVIQLPGTDTWYFFYLEYGMGGTTRQVYANRMEFNADGTIKPVQVDQKGIASNFQASRKKNILPIALTASSFKTDTMIRATIDTAVADRQPGTRTNPTDIIAVQRTVTFRPENAADGSNGTYWMAASGDQNAWLQADLGAIKNVRTCSLYFFKPTLGTAWKLEKSDDGKIWKTVKTESSPKIMSPHVATRIGRTRYLKITILSGAPGLWEIKLD
ncbi:family 43 glycosylhydrolase [Mucilaginibacter sp. X5P1]|uniref:family 43 glycosylhydrolase n=1 Tax=Mucilaginibacter sp. X5P1 TaxID=2723088 RepID=UPI001622BC93|nr:family 43 glycosylhydrolase [Mucilaginibacter sp. X5P1]MBB6141941.1 hypothetical protein [Mucilaginibacter sp. X5P1]